MIKNLLVTSFLLFLFLVTSGSVMAADCAGAPAPILRVSISTDGTLTQFDGDGYAPVISHCGDTVIFSSSATLVASDTNGAMSILVRSTITGVTSRFSLDPDGAQTFSGSSANAAICAGGNFVVFQSFALNLDSTPGPQRQIWNVFRAPNPFFVAEPVPAITADSADFSLHG